MNEEELLLHFGVKGMKWGVRRARNSVGSVTRKFKDAHDKADASKNARRTASQERQNNSKFGQAHLKANAKKDARREKQNANLAEHKRLEKERADKVVSKAKDYAKVAGTAYKDGIKHPIASDKAARQLMKEKPKTALYRNKEDIKRLNQLTAQNVAAKKAKVEASKSYKEAQKNKKSEAKRKDTSDKVKDGINTKLSKSEISSEVLTTALYMSVGAVAAKSVGLNPTIGAGLGLGIGLDKADNKKR